MKKKCQYFTKKKKKRIVKKVEFVVNSVDMDYQIKVMWLLTRGPLYYDSYFSAPA